MILLANDLSAFIGRFHPLIVHLPIGFITMAVLLHWLSRKEKFKNLKTAMPTILLLSALTAFLSSFLGWLLAGNGNFAPNILTLHKWSGFTLGPLALLAWWKYRQDSTSRISHFIIYGMFIVLGFNGHQGGSLTHGPNYLLEKAPTPIASLLGFSKPAEMETELSNNLDSIFVFQEIIHPFLIEKCQDCHNEKGAEGDLIITTVEGIKKGGSEGLAFVGGQLKKSEIYQRLILPQYDIRFMPTSGKMPLTFNQIRILEWWIQEGAEYQKPLSEISAPKDIKELLEEEYGIPAKPLDFVDRVKIAPSDQNIITTLQTLGFNIKPLAPGHALLDVSIEGDSLDLKELIPIQSNITWLDLSGIKWSLASLEILNSFQNLSRLKLDQCELSNDDFPNLEQLEHLESLNIYKNNLDDTAIEKLVELASLKNLYLWENNFTDSGIESLKSKRPNLAIDNGFQFLEEEGG